MKKDIHPKYQKILFVDSSTGHKFVCGSTLQPKQMDKFEGAEYPVYHLSTSSASHPFFTGSKALVDSEGRVDKFKKRYAAAAQNKATHEESEGKLEEQPKEKEVKKESKKKRK
ncbi:MULTISPECIES: type B 50S ribosomal protein L31 [unclassified Neochlamydia]|uniref:type B 50S ribosomal protein L31 n=1 Tax=unclassified Neochlamydia TaxID=2643326 RepID=UPI00140C2ED4|nr:MULTISPECIES: type B 50S ribosomal protein L31 [unclassified Neochlamydia]MBS4166346.1 50S ribosomal protein L31 type B [Neochlamydia sp. AcF65]MBS4170858.1 50S ribosomal protein L31 type B [Neochlamydia sp. AcF95]NGY94846.1 50S ribosomal protein L31 type B [Neochlamydia sp. AcF84]